MRIFLKFLLYLSLWLLLLVGLGALSFSWWGPVAFERGVEKVLRNYGFSEAKVFVERMGLKQLVLRLDCLRYKEASLSGATLTLGYAWQGLLGGELEYLILAHPEVVFDYSDGWPPLPGGGDRRELPDSGRLLERFPVRELSIETAVVTLQGVDWVRTVRLDLELGGRESLRGEVLVQGGDLRIDAQADVLWPDLSGSFTASLVLEKSDEWQDWSRIRNWLDVPDAFVLELGPIQIKASGEVSGQRLQAWELVLENENLTLGGPGVGMESDYLSVAISGHSLDALHAVVGLSGGRITWSDGGGVLTGLEGDFELASLQPLVSKGAQALQFVSMEQGEFATGPGQLSLSYVESRAGGPPLDLQITTTALGGEIRMKVDGRIRQPLGLSARVFLDSVDLKEVAALFPQFDGQMEGQASGELALAFEEEQIALLPGGLQLKTGTSGRFAYLRQGWLTQDPKLNPEDFVGSRPVLEIMKDPRGAPALTELAMRDLKMTEFNFTIQQEETEELSVLTRIEGERIIKGVTVPVMLDIPIRGEIKETIDTIFEFNTRMRD